VPDIVVLDFDGTLCNTDPIIHLWGDWDAFHAAAFDCPARLGVVELARRLQTVCRVIVVTGKPEKYRAKMLNWLSVQGIIPDALLMRPMGNDMSDAQLKPQLVIEYQGNLINILCAIEDRDKMVDAWRALGVTCLQAAPCIEARAKKAKADG
jgi:hypothetical protein